MRGPVVWPYRKSLCEGIAQSAPSIRRPKRALDGNRGQLSLLSWPDRAGAEKLCDGCLSGRVPEQVATRASIEPELVHRVAEDDGGTSESYRGVLTVAGVRYSLAVSFFADLDGAFSSLKSRASSQANGGQGQGSRTRSSALPAIARRRLSPKLRRLDAS